LEGGCGGVLSGYHVLACFGVASEDHGLEEPTLCQGHIVRAAALNGRVSRFFPDDEAVLGLVFIGCEVDEFNGLEGVGGVR
jgi:hypothetical protein